jgi:hypothetical protein
MRILPLLSMMALLGCTPKTPAPDPFPAGALMVSMDGQSTWPPVGVGCEAAVACCEAMWVGDPGAEMMCKLSAASHISSKATSCEEFSKATRSYFSEDPKRLLAPACAAP